MLQNWFWLSANISFPRWTLLVNKMFPHRQSSVPGRGEGLSGQDLAVAHDSQRAAEVPRILKLLSQIHPELQPDHGTRLFSLLKKAFGTAPVLTLPDPGLPFMV